jgi:hypothetical protein
MPAVDLLGGLDSIKQKALANGYAGEYEFELDIASLIEKTFEGHLVFDPYLIGAFGFSTNVTLISISSDGIALPKIFFQGMPTQFSFPNCDANISRRGPREQQSLAARKNQ